MRTPEKYSALGGIALIASLSAVYACGDESNNSTSSNTTGSPGGTGGTGGNGGNGGTGAGPQGGGGTGGTGGGTGGGGLMNGADCTASTGDPMNVALVPLHQGLDQPLMVTYAPGDAERLYIVEQDGGLMMSRNGGVPTDFLNISGMPGFASGGERGFLGLAFHPDYITNGRFWVRYTATNPNRHVVQEFRRDPNNPDIADATPVHPPTFEVLKNNGLGNHNGGHIEFGPDGMLYVTIGDGGDQGDPDFFAQNLMSQLGKIHRIDVTPTDGTYTIPAGNAPNAAATVFDWGFRNPYRMSFDMCTGDRYIGDVGQNTWEEVSVQLSSVGPTNFGWNCFEGMQPYNSGNGCPIAGALQPVVAYDPGQASVIGGVVYRSSQYPALRGWYFYGEYYGFVRMFKYENGAAVGDQLVENISGITGFGNDDNGNVYVTQHNGTVYQVQAN